MDSIQVVQPVQTAHQTSLKTAQMAKKAAGILWVLVWPKRMAAYFCRSRHSFGDYDQ
jgi:hypothetical protein